MVVLKRLVKRENVHVVFALPNGNQEYDIMAGSNLRGEMIRLDVPVSQADACRLLPLSLRKSLRVGMSARVVNISIKDWDSGCVHGSLDAVIVQPFRI